MDREIEWYLKINAEDLLLYGTCGMLRFKRPWWNWRRYVTGLYGFKHVTAKELLIYNNKGIKNE